MESFDLKNVWNALTTMERETIIDAAKDSQGVVHFSSTERDWELGAVRRRTSVNSDQTETAC